MLELVQGSILERATRLNIGSGLQLTQDANGLATLDTNPASFLTQAQADARYGRLNFANSWSALNSFDSGPTWTTSGWQRAARFPQGTMLQIGGTGRQYGFGNSLGILYGMTTADETAGESAAYWMTVNNLDVGFFGTVAVLGQFLVVGQTGSVGAVRLHAGDASNIGYVEWFNPAGARQAYMGFGASGLNIALEPGNAFTVGGNVALHAGNSESFINQTRTWTARQTFNPDKLVATSGFSTYTTDGVWSSLALPAAVFATPGSAGRDVRIGYHDAGAGQYQGSIGFAAHSTSYSPGLLILQSRVFGGTADSFNRWQVSHNGTIGWGSGASSVDTTLSRPDAAELHLEGCFTVGAGYAAGALNNGDIAARRSATTGVYYFGDAYAYIYFDGSKYQMPAARISGVGYEFVTGNASGSYMDGNVANFGSARMVGSYAGYAGIEFYSAGSVLMLSTAQADYWGIWNQGLSDWKWLFDNAQYIGGSSTITTNQPFIGHKSGGGYTTGGMVFANSAAALQGYVYWSSGFFGLLDSAGSWRVQVSTAGGSLVGGWSVNGGDLQLVTSGKFFKNSLGHKMGYNVVSTAAPSGSAEEGTVWLQIVP